MNKQDRCLIDLDQIHTLESTDPDQVAQYLAHLKRGDTRRRIQVTPGDHGCYEVQSADDAAWVEACRQAGLNYVSALIKSPESSRLLYKVISQISALPPGLSQQALADRLGVSRSTIRRALALSPLTSSQCSLHVWPGSVLEHDLPPDQIDLIASYAPLVNLVSYAPRLAQLLSTRGILWLVFEANQPNHLNTWHEALLNAGLAFRRLAVWVMTRERGPHNPQLSGYRFLLSCGKLDATAVTTTAYPGIVGPRVPGDIAPNLRLIPAWLWTHWLCEQPASLALDPFGTSPTLFDAARRRPELRQAWVCPIDRTVHSLLQHYLSHDA